MNPENIVERLRKVSMAKAKAMWPEAGESAKKAGKGDYAQDMRDDLDDYYASRHGDDDDLTMPAADDPGWHHVGGPGPADDDGSDGDGGSGKGEKYDPRFGGITLSDKQRKKAADNRREAAEKQKAKEESREKAYAESGERFQSVRGAITFHSDSAGRHGMTDKAIEKIISETSLAAVDFGYGEGGESGGLLFQIVLRTGDVSGLRTIVGRIRDDDLYVFHAGATGGSQFTRLEY
jgi:hypothetical protein